VSRKWALKALPRITLRTGPWPKSGSSAQYDGSRVALVRCCLHFPLRRCQKKVKNLKKGPPILLGSFQDLQLGKGGYDYPSAGVLNWEEVNGKRENVSKK